MNTHKQSSFSSRSSSTKLLTIAWRRRDKSHCPSGDETKQSRSLKLSSREQTTENRCRRRSSREFKRRARYSQSGRQSLEHRMSSVRDSRDHLSRLDQEGNGDAKDFSKSEAVLVDVTDTLQHWISNIEIEMAKNPTFLQKGIDTRNTNNAMVALITMKTSMSRALSKQCQWWWSVPPSRSPTFHAENTAALVGIEQFFENLAIWRELKMLTTQLTRSTACIQSRRPQWCSRTDATAFESDQSSETRNRFTLAWTRRNATLQTASRKIDESSNDRNNVSNQMTGLWARPS